jgi:hypothetical protein
MNQCHILNFSVLCDSIRRNEPNLSHVDLPAADHGAAVWVKRFSAIQSFGHVE